MSILCVLCNQENKKEVNKQNNLKQKVRDSNFTNDCYPSRKLGYTRGRT